MSAKFGIRACTRGRDEGKVHAIAAWACWWEWT